MGDPVMPTRRTVLVSALAAAAVGPTVAHAQSGPAPITALLLERRTIEVNGKPASVFGIRQTDGTYGITTRTRNGFPTS
jgi:uncharacterized Zn-binding protein involved in type VI secretion